MTESKACPVDFDWSTTEVAQRLLSITGGSDANVPMMVRVIVKGEHYGLNGSLVHDKDDPLVEFYDLRHPSDRDGPVNGQFISRYYLSTLLRKNQDPLAGLCLDGRVPDWVVPAIGMVHVRAFLAFGPQNGCLCPVCEQYRAFQLHLRHVPAASQAFFEALYERLTEVEGDLSMATALVEGRLPNADDLIQRRRARLDRRCAETKTLPR